ncbi:MAG: sugar phosphate isomerase/epimerase [Kiritimatiellae bacterium]|nr:sugar phosphate isomerase/epimerase [Kiritimatiellia bacterium]
MLHSGLVSVSFRDRSPEELVKVASEAGLEGVEWGGDVHVPHGDLAKAREVRRLTERAGLSVPSYGSYYRAGVSEGEGLPFKQVLETAAALGAPLVRVWAGKSKSADADEAYRGRVADDSRRIADMAAGEGIAIAYEYHMNTLTDSNASAERLLRDVAHENMGTYWQRIHQDAETCMAGLKSVLPWVRHVHANHRQPGSRSRALLREGEAEWMDYLREVAVLDRDVYVMIEFVKDNALESFRADAEALKQWIDGIH